MITDLFGLLVCFQLKHFLCDYPLQSQYMLGKAKTGLGWIGPLSLHAYIHAVFTFIICVIFLGNHPDGNSASYLSFCLLVFDFAVHFIQDRVKASPNILGRWTPDKPYFWWALGQDQMVHHLTHYFIIYKLITFSYGL